MTMGVAQAIICGISVLGFIVITVLILLATKFGQEWAMAIAKEILPLVIGCWITNFTTVVNFVVGTSLSSQSKTDALTTLVERATKPRSNS